MDRSSLVQWAADDDSLQEFISARLNKRLPDGSYYIDRLISLALVWQSKRLDSDKGAVSNSHAVYGMAYAIKAMRATEDGLSTLEAIDLLESQQVSKREYTPKKVLKVTIKHAIDKRAIMSYEELLKQQRLNEHIQPLLVDTIKQAVLAFYNACTVKSQENIISLLCKRKLNSADIMLLKNIKTRNKLFSNNTYKEVFYLLRNYLFTTK